MQLLHPWMLLGLILVPATVLLHVFRTPGRRHEVSYLPLWRKVLSAALPESSERVRRFDWLLLLEILIVVLLVLGLAGPVIRHERPRRHVGFIIDLSASMKTIEANGRSRWEKAREKVASVLARLSGDDVVSVYAGPFPERSAVEIGPEAFGKTLDDFSPNDAAVPPETLLANGLAALGDAPHVIFLVTDNPPKDATDELGERLRVVTVGGETRNVGIVAFDVAPAEKVGHEAFVRVRNFSGSEAARTLTIEDASPERKTFRLVIPPGGEVEKVVHVEVTGKHPVLKARLEGADDGFAADDKVAAVLKPLPVVALGGDIPPAYAILFGGRVFENTLYLEAARIERGALRPGSLLIAVGVIPKAFGVTTVIVAPPAGEVAGISIGGEKTLAEATSPVPGDRTPLMKNVNLDQLKIDRYRPLTLPAEAKPILRTGDDTVAALTYGTEGRVVVLGFDPQRTRWSLKESFVVFWANVLDDVRKRSGMGKPTYVRPGEIVSLPVGSKGGTLRTSTGEEYVAPARDGWARVRIETTGLCTWESAGWTERLAVNLLSATESDNRPASAGAVSLDLPIPISAGKTTHLGAWLCVIAGFMTVVWWYFRR